MKPVVSRRDLLRTAGAGAAALGLAACGEDAASTSPSRTGVGTPDCVLTPAGTEGPYYLDLDLMRADLSEGRAGVPLRMALTVVDAETCQAIPGAAVDVWHADPDGTYSGTESHGTVGETYLRGVQLTDADGLAGFDTLYPGWYSGRTVHIHIKVHVDGDTVHTGQLYFPEEINSAVAEVEEYARHGGRDTANDDDMFYPSTGAGSTLDLSGSPEQGFTASMVVGVSA